MKQNQSTKYKYIKTTKIYKNIFNQISFFSHSLWLVFSGNFNTILAAWKLIKGKVIAIEENNIIKDKYLVIKGQNKTTVWTVKHVCYWIQW